MPVDKTELLKYCHRVYDKSLVAAKDGNLSVRDENGNIVITPSGKNKGDLTEADFIKTDNTGRIISGSGKPSSEIKIHLAGYNNRKDINAVVHCHPVYATVLAITKNLFDEPVLPEVILSLGKVPLCKYGTPSTEELPDSLLPYIRDFNVFLLENHGAVTFGKDIAEAYYRMEKLEQAAKILYLAAGTGNVRNLNKIALQKLYDISEQSYGIVVNEVNKYNME